MQTLCYLGLGSNLGRRETHLLRALAEISALPGTSLLAVSSFYVTRPVGMAPASPLFLNLCAGIRTELDPQTLVREFQKIERRMGCSKKRGPAGEYLDRIIDIDLLLYGERVNNLPGPPAVRIPHPGISERAFVLAPLVEIASHLPHPEKKKSFQRLLDEASGKIFVWRLPKI